MENKKGSGIFLGVVSVATLIVAIIGATFAYFSASASSENAINLSAYEFDMDIDIQMISPATVSGGDGDPIVYTPINLGGIIPLKSNLLLRAVNTGDHVGESGDDIICQDKNGHQVCALFKATITNNGATSETMDVSLTTAGNNPGSGEQPFLDLKFQALSGTAGSFNTDGDAVDVPTLYTLTDPDSDFDATENPYIAIENPTAAQKTVNLNSTITVAAEGTTEFYFVVYLNETEDNQSGQMGATYSGILNLATGGDRITGTFNLGA